MAASKPLSHEQLAIEKTLADVRFLVMGRSFQSAAKRMGELRWHLEQHLDAEGRLVPLFISRTGDPGAVAMRLRREHDKIPRRLEAVCSAITQWDSSKALYELDQLALALDAHQQTEGELLHPALDDLVPDDLDWEALHFQLLGSETFP